MASRQWHVHTIEAKACTKSIQESTMKTRTQSCRHHRGYLRHGLATAKLFVEEGAYVFITGRRQEQLDQAVKEIGKNVTGVQGDVSHLADLDRLYTIVKAEKSISMFCTPAPALANLMSLLAPSLRKNFDRTFNVNVRGTLFTVQKALPLMRDGGLDHHDRLHRQREGLGGFSVYNASKAAVRSFARTWTVDLKARKIRGECPQPRHH